VVERHGDDDANQIECEGRGRGRQLRLRARGRFAVLVLGGVCTVAIVAAVYLLR